MSHHRTLPATRRRLVVPASPHCAAALPLPLFLRAPCIGLLWGLALLTVVTGFTLGRIRLPRVARGVAVAVEPAPDSLALLLLLPPSARGELRPGIRTTIDTGDGDATGLTVPVASVEPELLDASTARRRFPHRANLLAQLDGPKLVAWLSRCSGTDARTGTDTGTGTDPDPAPANPGPSSNRCLTLTPGASYVATAALGTRSLVSYAMPES